MLLPIFNSSFREGFISRIWKSADIVHLQKANPPKRLDKDLLPVSLTPFISKVQESFVHTWLWDSIKDKMDKGPFGALKGTCTTHVQTSTCTNLCKGSLDIRGSQYPLFKAKAFGCNKVYLSHPEKFQDGAAKAVPRDPRGTRRGVWKKCGPLGT